MNNNKLKALKSLENDLKRELLELNEKKKRIEEQLDFIQSFGFLSHLPVEGETISYKLGKILLDTNIKNIYLLPKKLLALRLYSKHRKNIINLNAAELESVNNTIEPKNIKNIPSQIVKSNTIEKSKLQGKAKENDNKKASALSILSIMSQESLLIYNKIVPTYHLMENNENQLKNTKANLFLVESVWSGVKNNWKYALLSEGFKSIQSKLFIQSLKRLKEKGLKFAFVYNEKLKHYNYFKSVIELSDIVFYTNPQLTEKILGDFKDKKTVFLPKSVPLDVCNPNNPVPFSKKSNVIYLGEYNKEFNDDNLDILNIFKDLPDNILELYRNENSLNEVYSINLQRWKTIANNTEFSEVIKLLKQFKFSFYIAEKDETDIPQKILDSLVCGVPVISTRNKYLEEIFNEIVIFVDNPEQMNDVVETYANDRWKHAHLAHKGYRFIMQNFPAYKIKETLEKEVNGRNLVLNNQPLVSIIMASMREHYIDRIVTNVSRQKYDKKEFIIVTQNFSEEGLKYLEEKLSSINTLVNFKIIVNNSEATLGERQNQAASYAKGDLLAKFDDDDFYFENYLTDMVLPFQLGNYDMVGKSEVFFYLEALDKTVLIRNEAAAYREFGFVSGATFVIKRSTFKKLGGFIAQNQSEDSNLLNRLKESGGKIYSSDPFNFVVFRSKDVKDHTWQQKAEAFMNSSLCVGDGIPTEVTVV